MCKNAQPIQSKLPLRYPPVDFSSPAMVKPTWWNTQVDKSPKNLSKNRFPIGRILFNKIQVEAYWTMQDQKLFRTCKQTNEGFIAGWGKKPVESEMPWRIMTSVMPVTNKTFWKELLPLQPNLFPYFKDLLCLQISPKVHPQTPLITNTSLQFTRECGNFKSTILDDPAWTKIMWTLVCNMNSGQVEAVLLDQSWVMAFLMFLSLILVDEQHQSSLIDKFTSPHPCLDLK